MFFFNVLVFIIFKKHFFEGSKWIKSPDVLLTDESIDDEEWDADRDFENIDYFQEAQVLGCICCRFVPFDMSRYCFYASFHN